MKDILKLARINGAIVQSYAAKLKQHKMDQTVPGSLTLQQLHDIRFTALGDRLKIFNFFSKDPDDCGSSRCQNKGTVEMDIVVFRAFAILKVDITARIANLSAPVSTAVIARPHELASSVSARQAILVIYVTRSI